MSVDLSKIKGTFTPNGYFVTVNDITEDEEKVIIDLNKLEVNTESPERKLRICFNCGKTWNQKSIVRPKTCPNKACHSTYWDIPKRNRPHMKHKEEVKKEPTGGFFNEVVLFKEPQEAKELSELKGTIVSPVMPNTYIQDKEEGTTDESVKDPNVSSKQVDYDIAYIELEAGIVSKFGGLPDDKKSIILEILKSALNVN